jgi:uncharacterized membrane protein
VHLANSQLDPEESANRNISAILALEHEALAARSRSERISDAIAGHAGRMWFLVMHAIWFAAWIVFNSRIVRGFPVIDPFPYQFLTFVTSLESIFLSLFILMSENRSNKQAEARSHLDLQINLLSEQESTKMLQMLELLCNHHKLAMPHDPELEQLKATTEPARLLKELQANLPEGI